MEPLKKTVTVQVNVDPRIADLVYFVKSLCRTAGAGILEMTDAELVEAAEYFWDTQHGED